MHFIERGSGPLTIVFLHGNLSSSRWWEKVFAFLPPIWRAIAPDFRGFGNSAAPPEVYRIEEMAGDLEVLARDLRLARFAVVGHSLGGGVGLQYALDQPKKVWALGLVDPVPAGGLHFPDEVFSLLASMKSNPALMREGLKATAPGAPDDEFFELLVQDALRSTPQAFLEIPKSTAGFNVSARIKDLSCPALCIHGERDDLIPREDVERMCRSIPRCSFVAMEGVGHSPPIEAPEALARRLIDFFSVVGPPDVL
jgi:pimeloyl-ACP methyl ester carboxylesterase